MKKALVILFAAALALVSSNRQEVPAQQQDLTVRFSTEQLSNYAFKSALEASDEVGVFAGQPIGGTNVLYTATADKKLTSDTPLKWIKGDETPVSFTAYRPYDAAVTSTTIDFAVKELNLYLDTHREDTEAFEMLQSLLRLRKSGRAEDVRRYGPIDLSDMEDSAEYDWLCDPWPWEYCERRGD